MEDNTIIIDGEKFPLTLENAKLAKNTKLIKALKLKSLISQNDHKHELLTNDQAKDLLFLKYLKRYFAQGAGIFNEMRTGKTPLILTFLQEEEDIDKVLIVVPPGLVLNWIEEIKKWAFRFKVFNLNLKKEQRNQNLKEFEKTNAPRIGVIGTSLANKDKLNVAGQVLVIDEAHFLTRRSDQTKRVRFLARKHNFVYALTATPTSKTTSELFDIALLIKPNGQKLDSWFYKDYFCLAKYNHFAYNQKEYTTIKKYREKEFDTWLKSNFTKKKFNKEGIFVSEEIIYLKPSKLQIQLEKEVEDFMEINGEDIANILVALIRLRQINTCPVLVGFKELGPKLTWLKEFLKDNASKGVIIFSNFTSLLEKLKSKIPRSDFLTGRISNKQKQANVKRFQNKEIDVLLANIVSGSKGWTLDRGEVIIFLDVSFAWEENDQAKARFWPTKEHLKGKHLKVYYLFLDTKIEHKMWKVINKKLKRTAFLNEFRN